MQGEFDFGLNFPSRPKKPERLFFGLLADPETAIGLDDFRQWFLDENGLTGSLIKKERFHVSLHHIGDFKRLKSPLLYAARMAGSAVSMHPFEMTFRFLKSLDGAPPKRGRPREWPLVLLGEGDDVRELYRTLGAALQRNGLRSAAHFVPHMTLLYGPKPIPMQAIQPIRVAVNEFVLIHSELGLTRYNMIDRWRLKGSKGLVAAAVPRTMIAPERDAVP